MRILVVEDTEDSRVLLVDYLEVQNYTVESAINGAEAYEKAITAPPDLIISDILMPEMDGFEFCKKIKQQPSLKNIPFIFYTATYTDPSDQRFALSLGADSFIIKPQAPSKLLAMIQEVIAMHKDRGDKSSSEIIEEDYFDVLHTDSLSRKLDKKVRDLENQKEQLRIITDAVPALIAEINASGRYSYVNKQYEEWFNKPRNEIIGKKPVDVIASNIYEAIKPCIDKALKGEEATYEGYVSNSEDEQRYILARYIPHLSNDGSSKGCFSFINDLTEQKLAEEENKELLLQLRYAQKMDALGQLTGGISHDYNNVLGIILGYTQLMELTLDVKSDEYSYIKEITSAASRGVKLSKKLLAFSHNDGTDESVVNINSLLQHQQLMLDATLTARIKLVFELSNELWPVYLDSSDLENAILNIAINAMHAIEGSGQLTFHTHNENLNDTESQYLNLTAGDYVVLSVTDTGCGIDEVTKDKIFDPFFTTKGEGGTGLGLSQVYGFIKRSNGAIRVTSELGQGSHFVMYFPRCEQVAIDS